MLFAASAQQSIDERQAKHLGEMLGVYWTRDTVEAMMAPSTDSEGEPRKDLLIPLLLGMAPQLDEYLRKSFGASRGISAPGWYRGVDKSQVIEGSKMPREDFIKLASLFTGLIPKTYKGQQPHISQQVGRTPPIRGRR